MYRKITLLLLTPNLLARVDVAVGKSPRVLHYWLRERFSSPSLAIVLEATLKLGKKPAGPVYVLNTSFWTGVVTLPPELSHGLSEAELNQSIGLEAESFYGVSGF